MTIWDHHIRWQEKGLRPSPLIGAPGLRMKCFRVDWLHCVDQGVAADFLGNLFCMIMGHLDGATETQRLKSLFVLIQEFYKGKILAAKLDNLTLGMLRPKAANAPPKLKCKAAECRCLIPFAVEMAERFLINNNNQEESAAKHAANHLAACYDALSDSAGSSSRIYLKENCRKFCLIYVALERFGAANGRWRVKPNLHLFQEMCEMCDSKSSLTWTYRDEDFGGTMAELSKIKGGTNSPSHTAYVILTKNMAKHPFPRIE